MKINLIIAFSIFLISCSINQSLKEEYNFNEMEVKGWYEPKDPTPKELCPCCDYVSLPERGTFLICPICFWEDDGLNIDKLDKESGPNHMTLREGRKNFKKFGACEESMVGNVVTIEERAQFEFIPRNIE